MFELETLTTKDLGILAVDLINEEFELQDCYSSLNYSAFLLREGSELAADELESGHPDLTEKERRKRLRSYLNQILKKLS